MSNAPPAGRRETAGHTLSASGLRVAAGTRVLVEDLALALRAGEFLAVLGRNGSGKTLTLHTLAGLRAPRAGSVRLMGDPLEHLPPREAARRLGILTQDLEEGFTTTVLESVMIGRHPHIPLLGWEGAIDQRIAQEALERVALTGFASRRTDTLSGGEQRRAAIAALLAQDPKVFLLDEPTNHLDPNHQLAVLSLFRELAGTGRSVVATLHEPTLAARFADQALLLFGDGRWRLGPTAEVLTEAALSDLYQTRIVELHADGRRVFVAA